MLGFLKNVFLTALMVCVATVATVTAAFVVTLFVQTPTEAMPEPAGIVFAILIAGAMAMLAGMFFCLLTLLVAAVTMPPTLWAARWLKLPRPAVDIVGGVCAAWLCAMAGLEEADSLANYGMTLPPELFVGLGVIAGGLVGYVRYRALVAPAAAAPSSVVLARAGAV